MSCTSRIRWPPTSKLCGDSNSSVPNADCARDALSPCVVAVVAAEHAGERHVRILENGSQRERRAVVARVEHHADAGVLHLLDDSAIAGSRSCVSAIRPTRIRSAPPLGLGGLAAHQILVLFARGDDREPVAVDQDFGGARARVVVRRHRVAVGADVVHGEQLARARRRRSRGRARGNRRSRRPDRRRRPCIALRRGVHAPRCDGTRRSATAAAAPSFPRR